MELKNMSLVVLIITIMWAGSKAQTDCTNVIISLSPCLNYITGNSSTPSSACCSQLGTVVRSSPQCLCQVLTGGDSSFGINVNQTQALALPGQCNVQTPPVSRCNNATSPAASPSGSPESPSTPSGDGSKTVPSTDSSNTSDGSSIKLSISFFLILLVVSWSSALVEY